MLRVVVELTQPGWGFMSQLSTSLVRRFNSNTSSTRAVKQSDESMLTDAVDEKRGTVSVGKHQSGSSVSLSLLATHTPLAVQHSHRRAFSQQNMNVMSQSDSSAVLFDVRSHEASACSSDLSSSSFDDVSVEDSLVMMRREEEEDEGRITSDGQAGKGRNEEEVTKLTTRLQHLHTLGLQCAQLIDQHISESPNYTRVLLPNKSALL